MKLFPLLALVILGLAPCSAWASPASEEADIANSLARQGCYDTAVMFYEKALRLNPGFGPAIAGRAAALRKLSKTSKAPKGKKPREVVVEDAQDTAARAKSQEAAAAKRAALAAAAAAKPKPVAAVTPSKTKSVVAVSAPKPKPATVKPKPIAAVSAPKPKPVVAVTAPKPKPVAAIAVTAPKPKPVVAVAVTAPKPKPVAAIAVTAPKPKPVVAVAPPSHTEAILTPAKPLAAMAAVKPVLAHMTVPNPRAATSATQEAPVPVPHTAPPVDRSTSVAVPANVGSAPPVSAMADNAAHSAAGDKVPGWLIGMAVGTFLLLIVLAIWWLSPTLSASRQLHDRLKGLERTRDER